MKLSEAQLFDQIKLLKPSPNRLPTVEVILDYVSKELNLPANEELFDIIKLQLRYYKQKASQLQKQKGTERGSLGDPAKIVIDTAVIDNTVFNETPEPEKKKRKTKHFDDLKKRQLLKRTQAIWDEIQICKFAEQEEVPEWRLLGLLLTRCDDMDASKVGQSLWDGSFKENKNEDFISVDTAVTLMADSSLGRQSYTNQRKLLKNSDKDILPPWKHLRSHQEQITPGMHLLPQPHIPRSFFFKMCLHPEKIPQNVSEFFADSVPKILAYYPNILHIFRHVFSAFVPIFQNYNNFQALYFSTCFY